MRKLKYEKLTTVTVDKHYIVLYAHKQ